MSTFNQNLLDVKKKAVKHLQNEKLVNTKWKMSGMIEVADNYKLFKDLKQKA